MCKIKEDKRNPSTKKETTLYSLVIVSNLVAPELPLTNYFTFNLFFYILLGAFSGSTFFVIDLMNQVLQLLRAELEELVSVI